MLAGFVTSGTIFVVKGENFVGRRLVMLSSSMSDEDSVSPPVGSCVVGFLILVVVVATVTVVLVVGVVGVVGGSVGMSI